MYYKILDRGNSQIHLPYVLMRYHSYIFCEKGQSSLESNSLRRPCYYFPFEITVECLCISFMFYCCCCFHNNLRSAALIQDLWCSCIILLLCFVLFQNIFSLAEYLPPVIHFFVFQKNFIETFYNLNESIRDVSHFLWWYVL